MTTLDRFGMQIAKKQSKKGMFLLKYGITKEKLIDRDGKPISDAILYKAEKFIEFDRIKKDNDSTYIIHPIEGYNKTAYTVRLSIHGDDINGSCNCQYAMYNKLCSHLLAVLIKYEFTNSHITVSGGVR